ncbi:phospholipase B-like 1 [Tachyglossus aculeatus]|uniref:phospholipase B-like 1 n=1 Tax=Tachyglossus aculeatus TaxID=9261 RepID=UPI0018F64628|nr:phospholipase B-like 1 [Tachyglossus aculeatus]
MPEPARVGLLLLLPLLLPGPGQWSPATGSAGVDALCNRHGQAGAADGGADIRYATAYWESATQTVRVKDVLDGDGDAYGFYNHTVQTTGWGTLEIRAGYGAQALKNDVIMFVAGFLEGYLTAPHIQDHFSNLYPQLIKQPLVLEEVMAFLGKQERWARRHAKDNRDDPFWRHVGYVLAQMDGLTAGAEEWANVTHAKKSVTRFQVQFLNAVGDLLDLIPALFPRKKESWLHGPPRPSGAWDMGHCSALIKVLPGYENVYLAHSSWFSYAAMLRIYKHWDFNIRDTQTRSARLSFSSYPGFLMSLDDFYLLSSGLAVLQTTNNVFNTSLLRHVVPQALLAWQRVRVANMVAQGGRDWARAFSRFNSGTYNNQYMILDLKKVKLKESLGDETLFIVEQIPTLVKFSDQTNVLRAGYWASYNVPFHSAIYNLSGYPSFVRKFGLDFSYELAPRAKIFRRDQGKVTDLESMKFTMRYNNYQKDPYSRGNPCNTICCREDLNASAPVPGGCYDAKVSDLALAARLTAHAVSGPTVQGGLPVFRWSRFNSTVHKGLPEAYDFDFVTMRPVLRPPWPREAGGR